MSLLFLTSVLAVVQALDDNGDPLPFAVLTFWQTGTVEPQAVYSDPEALVQLNDVDGDLVADAQGFFPLIYLHPTAQYRVRLCEANGVMRWDIDPYVCDCTEPPFVFRVPPYQALTKVSSNPPRFEAPSLAGALIRLTTPSADGDTPLISYADPKHERPHTNPVRSNAAGVFPPIYLDDDLDYRVRLEDADGTVLLDFDPYICECGFLLITSRPYAAESEDAFAISGSVVPVGLIWQAPEDYMGLSAAVISGTLREVLRAYTDALPEAIEISGAVVSGLLDTVLLDYPNYAPEALEFSASVPSGVLDTVLIDYPNYQPEALESSASVLGGVLS